MLFVFGTVYLDLAPLQGYTLADVHCEPCRGVAGENKVVPTSIEGGSGRVHERVYVWPMCGV